MPQGWVVALTALVALACQAVLAHPALNATGVPAIPDPPDAEARLAELRSYAIGSCKEQVPTVTDAKLAFGVIARGEAPYIEQFVMYHLFIGVDLIYLYDNEDEPTYHRMFTCNPRVKVIYFPDIHNPRWGIQILAQQHFMENFNKLHTWAMLPNADEFIVMKRFHNIKDLAAKYITHSTPGLAMQWLFFGHNDQVYTEDVPLPLRFPRRNAHMYHTSKTMFFCSRAAGHNHPHYPSYLPGGRSRLVQGANPDKFRLPASVKRTPEQANVPVEFILPVHKTQTMIYHYYSKSLEESINRREFRTPPNVPLKGRTPETEEAKQRARRVNRNRTIELIGERRAAFVGKRVNEAEEDRTLADFWMRHLDALYWETRAFNYNGSWPVPLRIRGDQRLLSGVQ